MLTDFVAKQFHSASRCQNKSEHTEAWHAQSPPGRADFVAENVHERRLFDTGQPVKKKTEPASGDSAARGWGADSDCPSTSEVQVQYIGDTNGSKHG